MKKVAVISDNKIIAKGENDGRIVDKYYTKVNGEHYFAASLVRQEDAELVQKLLLEQECIIQQAEKRQFEIRTVFNNILTSGLDSNEYPDIRKQEWFKQVKPQQ